MLVIVVVGFIFRLVTYGFIKLPWIIYDEYIYMDTARQVVRLNPHSLMTRDPQLYPAGWPFLFSAFSNLANNPYLEYRLILLSTMLISALVPVLAYFLVGNLLVAGFLAVYPPLFVYSSSIMSETVYIFITFLALVTLKFTIRDELKRKWTAGISGMVIGFLIYYLRLVRSFGVIYLPALVLAGAVAAFLIHRREARYRLLNYVGFLAAAVVTYGILDLVAKRFVFPDGGFYERADYFQAVRTGFSNLGLSFRLIKNELFAIFTLLLWVLPVFFTAGTRRAWTKKDWHEFVPRLFVVAAFVFSLALTLTHMVKGAVGNNQYLIFSRYLDPIIAVIFVYGLADLMAYVKDRKENVMLHGLWVLFIFYLLFWFKRGFYLGSYKFGNTMSVYFLREFVENPAWFYFLAALVLGMLYFFYIGKRRSVLYLFAALFLWQTFLSIKSTLSTPAYVTGKYREVVREWNAAMLKFPKDTPLCIYEGSLSPEVYYLYHFLYPYQYLVKCGDYKDMQPKRIISGADTKKIVPASCLLNYRFVSGELLYYCPLGY